MHPAAKILAKILRPLDLLLDTDYHVRVHNRAIGFHNPDYRFAHEQIAFIHVPKSAGTSAHGVLAQDPKHRFVNLDQHLPVSRHCPPGPFQYFTIVRDPMARVWSYYQMVLQGGPQEPYHWLAKKGLKHFLAHCWEVRNLACRYYSGRMAEPDQDTLALALANLAKFARVILFENFADEFPAYAQSLGIPLEDLPHARKASYAGPTDEDKEQITAFNRLDMEMYIRLRVEA